LTSPAASLVTLARRALAEAEIARGATILVAVSGGPDSMALLDVLARLAPRVGFALFAHGVDHGLRPAAEAELDLAAAFAAARDVPFSRTRVAIARGGNLQSRARAARYEALARAAAHLQASAIATAHHADDRAETVLMRLMRGSGPRGLAVLPVRGPLPEELAADVSPRPSLVRPFVRARRRAVLAHLERHGIAWATDPSNEDPRFLRARVRREVLPLLEGLAPGVVDHLCALADQLSDRSDGAAFPFTLPRATHDALAELARSRSTSARVWLPNGLVVTLDPRARPGPRPPPEPRRRREPRCAPGSTGNDG